LVGVNINVRAADGGQAVCGADRNDRQSVTVRIAVIHHTDTVTARSSAWSALSFCATGRAIRHCHEDECEIRATEAVNDAMPIVAVPRKLFVGVNTTFVPLMTARPLVGLTEMMVNASPSGSLSFASRS